MDTADEPADWVDDVDTPDEVDAAFRSQRRAAMGHFLLFGLVVGGCLLGVLSLAWWTESRLLGGLSPGFLIVGGGLHVVFVAIALSAVTLANGLEDSMMGRPPDHFDSDAESRLGEYRYGEDR